MEKSNYIQSGEFLGNRINSVDPMTHTDSEHNFYEEFAGIDLQELAGKKVLDIGGEPGGYFAVEAKNRGINLITVNPSTNHESYSEDRNLERGGYVVGGIAQELPFADSTFDFEISYGSVPAYLPPVESEYRHMFTEMLRVSKEEGVVYIYPILNSVKEDEIFRKINKELSSVAEFDFEQVDTRYIDGVLEKLYRLKITKKKQDV